VHQNPVKAGVCSRTVEYKWSSDRHYRGLESKNRWLDTDLVLDTLSSDRKAAIKEETKPKTLDEILAVTS